MIIRRMAKALAPVLLACAMLGGFAAGAGPASADPERLVLWSEETGYRNVTPEPTCVPVLPPHFSTWASNKSTYQVLLFDNPRCAGGPREGLEPWEERYLRQPVHVASVLFIEEGRQGVIRHG